MSRRWAMSESETYFEMFRSLKFADIGEGRSLVVIWFTFDDLVLQKGEIIETNLLSFATDRQKNIL